MSHAAGTRQRDVDLTFHALIKANFEVGANVGKVIYNDMLQDRTALTNWWVEIHKIMNGCRQGIATLYQIDVVYEVGDAADQATQDRYGIKATDKADEFLELVIPDNDLPFKIYNYAAPAAPVLTEYYARVIDDLGAMGESNQSTPIFDPDKGLIHAFMTIPVKHAVDLIRLPFYR